jgi:hypothetical protein
LRRRAAAAATSIAPSTTNSWEITLSALDFQLLPSVAGIVAGPFKRSLFFY